MGKFKSFLMSKSFVLQQSSRSITGCKSTSEADLVVSVVVLYFKFMGYGV
jgi:hypothetical protein